jgi:hypothetical protein
MIQVYWREADFPYKSYFIAAERENWNARAAGRGLSSQKQSFNGLANLMPGRCGFRQKIFSYFITLL